MIDETNEQDEENDQTPEQTTKNNIKIIKSDQTTKQIVRYHLAAFLATIEGFDCYEHLRKIVILLLSIKEHRKSIITYLNEIHGEQKTTRMINDAETKYVIEMKMLNELRGMLRIATLNNKDFISQLIDQKIRLISTRLAPIHDSLIRVFIAALEVSDLRYSVTPTELIMQATIGKINFRPHDYGFNRNNPGLGMPNQYGDGRF